MTLIMKTRLSHDDVVGSLWVEQMYNELIVLSSGLYCNEQAYLRQIQLLISYTPMVCTSIWLLDPDRKLYAHLLCGRKGKMSAGKILSDSNLICRIENPLGKSPASDPHSFLAPFRHWNDPKNEGPLDSDVLDRFCRLVHDGFFQQQTILFQGSSLRQTTQCSVEHGMAIVSPLTEPQPVFR
ncbi:hypothetical protein LY78DRAFT_201727 [Colletotrichum sublineola]|nr:hypothetical protein LY78DRAFT_201727 [Colletotrichum sublineola]